MADDELEERLARALDDDAPLAPSADRIAVLRRRAEAARTATTPAAASDGAAASTRRRRRAWPAVAAAAVVALVAGFALARLVDRDAAVAGTVEYEGPMRGTDGQVAAASLSVTGTGIGRVVDLHTDVLPILPVGEYYEVWFVAPDDDPDAPHRISAGTFHPDPDGRSDVRFAAAVDPRLYPVVEITAQPGGGDPFAIGPVILSAALGP